MLHTRFTVAVALAVAAVTLAITAVAFFVLRSDLQDQVKQELLERGVTVQHEAQRYDGHIPSGWIPPQSDRFGVASPYTQLVTAQGEVWAPRTAPGCCRHPRRAAGRGRPLRRLLQPDHHGRGARHGLTTPLAPGLAMQLAEPLNTVDSEVTTVATTLSLLSAMGVALAALAGRGVARAGLAPVARLAAVAEQVTATGVPVGEVEVHRPDELGRLAASFNKMLHALHRSQDAQQQLVGDASHELRTPLTSLRINAELLAANPGLAEAERQEVLDRVVAQVAELGDLVAKLTELARGESVTTVPEDVELHTIAAACLRAARQDWPRTPFTAELEPVVVFGSAERLQIAVRNLLDNAAKFSPPGAPVTLRLAAPGAHRAGPGARHRPRGPAARLRPLLPRAVGPRRARLRPRPRPSSARWRRATAAPSRPSPRPARAR